MLVILISSILGNVFLSSFLSGSRPWDSFLFMQRTFKKCCIVSYFLNLIDTMSTLSHSCTCASSLFFEKTVFLKLTRYFSLRNNHILTKVMTFSESTSDIKVVLYGTLSLVLLTSAVIQNFILKWKSHDLTNPFLKLKTRNL